MEDWDRLTTQMIREMIRQFLKQPGEFLTFGKLAYRIPDADKDVLHALAEQRPDLFVITRNEKAARLHTEAVRRIVQGKDVEAPPAVPSATRSPEGIGAASARTHCGHFERDEILADLQRSSLPAEALVRTCCWKVICRLRGSHPHLVDDESWRDICRVRGYLLARQNPRGF